MNKENLSEERFSIRDTNVLKGISILLLMFHHLFYNIYMLNQESQQVFLIPVVSSCLTRWGFVCIFVFAALSGYGIMAAFENEYSIKK